MQIKYSWSHRVREITQALDGVTSETVTRPDVEVLFHVQRRAALRLMEKLKPELTQSGEWVINRTLLRDWLDRVSNEIAKESSRSEGVRRAVGRAELEKQQLRAELKKHSGTNFPVWTVDPTAFTRRVQDLPECIQMRPGMVTVSFSLDDPARGAQLLHELSLAMLSDWRGFCAKVGIVREQSDEETIEMMLKDLEFERIGGLS